MARRAQTKRLFINAAAIAGKMPLRSFRRRSHWQTAQAAISARRWQSAGTISSSAFPMGTCSTRPLGRWTRTTNSGSAQRAARSLSNSIRPHRSGRRIVCCCRMMSRCRRRLPRRKLTCRAMHTGARFLCRAWAGLELGITTWVKTTAGPSRSCRTWRLLSWTRTAATGILTISTTTRTVPWIEPSAPAGATILMT